MKGTYDIKKKIALMAIVSAACIVLLGLNACQKTETETGTAVEAAGKMIDKENGTLREVAVSTVEQATVTATTAGEMASTAGDKAGEAYRAANDTLDKAVDNGGDAYVSATKMVDAAMKDGKDAVQASGESASAVLNQVTTPKSN